MAAPVASTGPARAARGDARPGVVTTVAFVLMAFAALALLAVAATLLSPEVRAEAEATSTFAGYPYGMEAGLAFGAAIGLAGLAAGWGLLTRQTWAWTLAVTTVSLSIAESLLAIAVELAGGGSPQASPVLIYGGLLASVAVYAALLALLLRPAAKAWADHPAR